MRRCLVRFRRSLILVWFLAFCVVPPAPLVSAAPGPDRRDCRPAELFITDTESPLFEPQAIATIATAAPFGAAVTGSTPLDGVFWSEDRQQIAFERSREFHLCVTDATALHAAAAALGHQFDQDAVLTFDYQPQSAPGDGTNGVAITVPDADFGRFGEAFAADATARRELLGGSVTTTDHTLILIAGCDDLALARRLVEEAGGRWESATLAFGRREFVQTAELGLAAHSSP
ncbi:hypothetical protein BST27_21225 [Mycobacterium intermedium]|uniref:Uncharacterized protein n=1 Tax=Mycobacterium intermedium TaxID=28445 RepID=A0A1E3SKZ5_MYCIE|nr:hypothetical protein [Mycobacterium intermedium]ODR02791.1 hypothetical protein BHQ20_02200 [Mycobacterium intermedium]OPE45834.1 hypothetical protein BV508_28235 [Mycobacterium intermedium]ORA98131.1 hypothetical protein BST27_21225 [Mycobacterium intermedium]